MKKVILFLCMGVFSLNAQSCNVTKVKTKDDIETVQECIIKQLKDIKEYFKEHKKLAEDIDKKYTKLMEEEAYCKNYIDYAKESDSWDTMVKDCKKLYNKRLKNFMLVEDNFRDAKKLVKQLEGEANVLKAKKDFLKRNYDALVGN